MVLGHTDRLHHRQYYGEYYSNETNMSDGTLGINRNGKHTQCDNLYKSVSVNVQK